MSDGVSLPSARSLCGAIVRTVTCISVAVVALGDVDVSLRLVVPHGATGTRGTGHRASIALPRFTLESSQCDTSAYINCASTGADGAALSAAHHLHVHVNDVQGFSVNVLAGITDRVD